MNLYSFFICLSLISSLVFFLYTFVGASGYPFCLKYITISALYRFAFFFVMLYNLFIFSFRFLNNAINICFPVCFEFWSFISPFVLIWREDYRCFLLQTKLTGFVVIVISWCCFTYFPVLFFSVFCL